MGRIFGGEGKMKDGEVGSGEEKVDMVEERMGLVREWGYEFMGMDEFGGGDEEVGVGEGEGVVDGKLEG